MTGHARASTVRRFHVCIHDGTPAYATETRMLLRDLAPRVGRCLSVGVVPNWHGEWPIAAYPDYCRLVRESAEELLLHGYFHHRQRGWGPLATFARGCDEMNGLDRLETTQLVARGQAAVMEAFGTSARGFLSPGWQAGRVRPGTTSGVEVDHVLGFFAIESAVRRPIRLATWTWDCGRWSWLGHVGHGVGWLLHSPRRVPVLAIHPGDLLRGFWPGAIHLIDHLIARGYEPTTVAGLLEGQDAAGAF